MLEQMLSRFNAVTVDEKRKPCVKSCRKLLWQDCIVVVFLRKRLFMAVRVCVFFGFNTANEV